MASKNILVAGAGRFGSTAASTLFQLGHDVLVVDQNRERIQNLIGKVTYSVVGNAADEILLRDLGVQNFDIAIVAIGRNVEASIMTAVLLNSFDIPMIVARATNQLHSETLFRIGCNRVINAEEDSGERMANLIFNPDVLEYMTLGSTFGIGKLALPDRMHNMTIADAGFTDPRDRYRLSVIALLRGDSVRINPHQDDQLRHGDHIVVAGEKDLVDSLTQ